MQIKNINVIPAKAGIYFAVIAKAGKWPPVFAGVTVVAGLLFSLPAMAQTIITRDDACRYLTEHRPADDVTYQAGVDVHGKTVVPADIDGPQIAPPAEIEIPLTVDVGEYSGIDTPDGVEMDAPIGVITVKNNELYFNGEPLKPETEQALIAACEDEDKGADE